MIASLLLVSVATLVAGNDVWLYNRGSSPVGNEFCGEAVDNTADSGHEPGHNQMVLQCDDPLSVIQKINFASYGTPGGGCVDPSVGTCYAANTTSVVSSRCLNKNSCVLHYFEEDFGDPCFGITKHLLISATCNTGIGRALTNDTAPTDITPTNVFTLFRNVFDVPTSISAPYVRIAADSNAAMFLNGYTLTRKVTRYREQNITADKVILPQEFLNAAGSKNVLVVRHHSWGNIETFQRTGQVHTGLYMDSNVPDLLSSGSNWKCVQDPQFLVHSEQIVGIGGAHRIRFPQIVNISNALPGDYHAPTYDDSAWSSPSVVPNSEAVWPTTPPTSETTEAGILQGGEILYPFKVLRAGILSNTSIPPNSDPVSIAQSIYESIYNPDANLTSYVQDKLMSQQPFSLTAIAPTSFYITFDFNLPIHGYPFLNVTANANTVVDFGYTEKPFDLFTGNTFVNATTGWIDPIGIVGTGYADRLITKNGGNFVEMPDERTARWLTLHFHIEGPGTATVTANGVGIQSWMYSAPLHQHGSFNTSDDEINAIADLSLIFAKISMSDAFVDTPGREDGSWIEDARPRGLIAARWFNDTALRQVLVRHCAECQYSDGNLHPFPPSNYPARASADWAVQWVAAMYDDMITTGSPSRVQRFWPQLTAFWDYTLATLRPEDGVWTGACTNDIRNTASCVKGATACSSGMVTPWMIQRLRWSVEMAESAGKQDVADQWEAVAAKMTDAFYKYHLVPASGSVPAHVPDVISLVGGKWVPNGYSQAGQTVAVMSKLLNGTLAKDTMSYAFLAPNGTPPAGMNRWNNPTYLRRSLAALSTVGLTGIAIEHLKERFNQYRTGNSHNPVDPILQGTLGGPLPEYWLSRIDVNATAGEIDGKEPRDGTGSHGWTSVALEWMHSWVLGVRYTSDEGYLVAPDNGNALTEVSGETFLRGQAYSVVWTYRSQTSAPSCSLELEIPDGPSITLAPVFYSKDLSLRLKRSPVSGQSKQLSPLSFRISGGGQWEFEC